MRARLIREVGTRAYLRVYVFSDADRCRGTGYHDARIRLADSSLLSDWDLGGREGDHEPERWPSKCDSCGADFVGKPFVRQVFHERLYDTASGRPEPGDLFWATWCHWDSVVTSRAGVPCPPTTCVHGWSNCDGRHLLAILPNGHEWDIDGRCSNCTLKNDFEHRCWVRSGEPPLVTVGKGGRTCSAGAGSISVPGWHGFLTNGEFRAC